MVVASRFFRINVTTTPEERDPSREMRRTRKMLDGVQKKQNMIMRPASLRTIFGQSDVAKNQASLTKTLEKTLKSISRDILEMRIIVSQSSEKNLCRNRRLTQLTGQPIISTVLLTVQTSTARDIERDTTSIRIAGHPNFKRTGIWMISIRRTDGSMAKARLP